MIGISAGIRLVQDELAHTLRGTFSVLLTGEAGVGKAFVARLIHDQGVRAAGPFVALRCADLPEAALERRLFGPEYGSSSSSAEEDASQLESANGGTLFIDAIDRLGLSAQSALLRFLDSRRPQRVPPGRRCDRRMPALDVRIIASAERPLLLAIAEKRFLEQLYYRLNVVHIQLPPLRDRREDIPVLTEHFVRECAAERHVPPPEVTAAAMACLMGYCWPGNVAELRAVAEGLALSGHRLVDVAALPAAISRSGGDSSGRCSEAAAMGDGPAALRSVHEQIFLRLLEGQATFWSAVYEPFMRRDLTRTDVRAIVALAVQCSPSSFAAFAQCLGVQAADQRRLMAFLRKCHCALPRPRMSPASFTTRRVRPRRATA